MKVMETVVNEEVVETAAEVVVNNGFGKGTKIAIGAAAIAGTGIVIKKFVAPKVKKFVADKRKAKADAKFENEDVNVVDVNESEIENVEE